MRSSLYLTILCRMVMPPISLDQAMEKKFVFPKLFLRGSANKSAIVKWTARSKADCARECASLSQCRSFSVGPSPWSCTLYSSKTTPDDVSPASSPEQEEAFHARCSGGAGVISSGYAIIPMTGKCLWLEKNRQNWTQAQEKCAAEGGQLLVIEDVSTLMAVGNYLGETDPLAVNIYVGGLKQGANQWLWLDDRTVGVNMWHPGEPNSWSGHDCIQLWNSNGVLLLDNTHCKFKQAFLCEM